jgi:hypothetical protein
MARPEIPEEKYIDAIHQLLAEGIDIDTIKPAKLQQAVIAAVLKFLTSLNMTLLKKMNPLLSNLSHPGSRIW